MQETPDQAPNGGLAGHHAQGRDDLLAELVKLRKALGKTQTEVAADMGVAQHHVSRLEHGKDPRIASLRKYAHALGAHLSVSLGRR